MAVNIHLKLENRIKVCREYTELWQTYFQFFADDLSETQITPEMENEFEGVINILALNYYKFQELCGPFMKECEEILKILSETYSLEAVKLMADATRSKLLVEWHRVFIDMNKALGRMLTKLTPKQLQAMQAADGTAQQAPPAA